MRFAERKEFIYSPDVFTRHDVQIALRIHDEYVRKHSPGPPPKFFEIDRNLEKIDPLWHVSLDDRTVFSRELLVPAIITKDKPDWRLTKVGLVPQQAHKAWVSNLGLQSADWWPARGDLMFYDGYRHMIVNVVIEPKAIWQQTNVWLGLVLETVIPADGDARPLINQACAVPAERTNGATPAPAPAPVEAPYSWP